MTKPKPLSKGEREQLLDAWDARRPEGELINEDLMCARYEATVLSLETEVERLRGLVREAASAIHSMSETCATWGETEDASAYYQQAKGLRAALAPTGDGGGE